MPIATVLALLVKVIAQHALHLPIAQTAIQGIIYLLEVVRFHFIIILLFFLSRKAGVLLVTINARFFFVIHAVLTMKSFLKIIENINFSYCTDCLLNYEELDGNCIVNFFYYYFIVLLAYFEVSNTLLIVIGG